MSWDIVLLNSREKITKVEDLDPDQLEETDFCSVFENHFKNIYKQDTHRVVEGKDYSFDYTDNGEKRSNMTLNLYGENALYELIFLAKKHGWQIFDTGLGEMIDLENPGKNGFDNFQSYLQQILKS